MTQIFTGSGLGIQYSSLSLGKYVPKGGSALGQGGESVYVNAANGNLVLRESDGFLANAGFGVDLMQTYNSRGEVGGSWCFNVQSHLQFCGDLNQEGSSVIRVDEDGHRSHFVWNAKKEAYFSEEGGTACLTLNFNGWTYSKGSQKTFCHYDLSGQLTDISDQDSHSVHYTYENNQLFTITDNSGRQKITWVFQQGLLQDVTTTSDGNIIHHLHYDYDEYNRLQKLSRDLGQGKSYWITYDYVGDSNWISEIKQSDGTKLHIDYDAQGRVKKLTDGEGRITTYDYGNGQTTITNGLKESWTYYYDENYRLTGIDGPEQYRIRYYYEGTQLSSIIQGQQIWKFNYNEQGDCIRLEEPNGQITLCIYDATHHLISQTQYQAFDGNNHPVKPQTTRYIYDEQGHLLFEIAADGTVTENRYDKEGQLLSRRCYLHAVFDLVTLTEKDVLSQEALYAWTSQQNSQDVSLIDYSYDWRGQLTEQIHYSQVDEAGLGIPTGSLRTRTRYDAAGRLVEKSTPTANGWSTTQYIYDDLGRLIQTIDNQQHCQRFEYDDEHQRIIQTDTNGLQTLRQYDHSGLLLASIRLDATHSYGSTKYKYDAAGRLVAETGVDGLTTYFFYDGQGRLQAKVNANGQITEYHYNDEGFLLQIHQYAHHIDTQGWVETLLSFAQIKPEYSSNDRVSQIVYNIYNQVAYKIDAQGAVIGYTYDAQGHIISSTAYATRLIDYHPDKILSLEEIKPRTHEDDRSTFYYYDDQGRLQAKINGEGSATSYSYDHLGHLIETCLYANPVQKSFNGDWTKDKPSINARKDIHTYSLYDSSGLKIADIDGEGYLIEYRYNASGLLQEQCSYENALTLPININESSILEHIRPKSGQNDRHTYYQYNDLGLLLEEKTQNGLITTYSYDESGRLINKSLTDEKTHTVRQQQYRYDALGRVIQQLDELGCALLRQSDLSIEQIEQIWQQHSLYFTYDNAGLLQSKTNALQQTTRYFYDENQQLKYTLMADGAVTETDYNAFDQVETIIKYSAFLKGGLKELSTKEIKTRLELLKDERFDEITNYEYNSIGLMIAKHTGRNGLETVSYNAFAELEFSTQAIDSQNNKVTAYSYDRRGLLTHQIDDVGGLARDSAFQYDTFGWIAKQIDGRSGITRYTLNKRGEQIFLTNASNQIKKVSYDAFGRVLSETDYTHSNYIKTYIYDDKNNCLTLTNPLVNSKISIQYNAFGDKISLTDAKGNSTDYHYDDQGQLLRVDSPEQAFTEYHYDEAGQLLWQVDAGGHKIAYSYDAQGHVLSKTVDPEGLKITTLYQYDALGRQLQITEANGCIKQFIYDSQGCLIQSCIDPAGINAVTQFIYDARGLLVQQTELNSRGKNKVTAYQWDNLGRRCATIIDPEGLELTTRYQYDANDNLIGQIDANQHKTQFVYDANNLCRYQIDARGVVTEYIYDVNGNEVQTVMYANLISVLSCYTEASLKEAIIKDDKHDHYQFRTFDGAGRLTFTYDASGYATMYGYDSCGNLVKRKHFAQAIPLDVLKRGERPWPDEKGSRCDYFVYDGLNQLRFQCDNKGCLTESCYDLSGTVVTRRQYAHLINFANDTSYTIDYIEQHLITDSQKDKTSHYCYDQAGRLCLEISAQGVAKSYQYNGLNQVISSIRYALLSTPSESDIVNIKQLQQSANDRTNYYVYDPAGREIYRVSSEGHVLERQYDSVGNVIAQISHAKLIKLTQYNAEDIQSELQSQNTQSRTTQYEYDAAGRLLTEIDAEQEATYYTYDAQGNVLNKTEANHALWSYRYNETNQLIESISPITTVTTAHGQEQRSIITNTSYDSFGNVITVIRDATGIKQTRMYEYDNNNNQIKILYPDVQVNAANATLSNQRQEVTKTLIEETRFNAFNEVVATCDKAGNWQHFAYNDQGLLIFSVNTQGGLTQYSYDTFGRIITKTLYAQFLQLDKDSDFSIETLEKAHRNSEHDRHEYSMYNLDDQLIESSHDPVRMYNPKTEHYDACIKPTTKMIYNSFGEVVQTAVRLNESEWATTNTYYNKDGNVIAVIDAEGYLTTYMLNAFGETKSMTEYAMRAEQWDLERYQLSQNSSKDRTINYAYDNLGQLTSKTLKQVNVQRINNGHLEHIIRDITTTYSYDALGHLTCTTDAKGNNAYCYYDALGQLIAKVAPQTQDGRAATTYSYDALGSLVEIRLWAQGALEADEKHFCLNNATNQDIISSQEYDTQGQLISETDGLQNKVNYSYDANGTMVRCWRTLTQIDGSTLIQDKRYQYDSENHLVQTTTFKSNGSKKTEEIQYNVFGEVVAKGIDGQYNIHIDYDNLGRVWRSNTQGYYQIYVYDLIDHVTQIVTSTSNFRAEYGDNGVDLSTHWFEEVQDFDKDVRRYDLQRQNNTYDALGHLLMQSKEFTKNSKAQSTEEQLAYVTQTQQVDRWGNMLSFTNARGFQTLYEYNAFNQVIQQELPEVKVVDEHGVARLLKPVNRYAYDELGEVIAMIDANGHLVSKEYDAFGRIITETDAKGAQRTKQYDLLNQLKSSKNELGGITTYIYDKANRLVSVTTPKTQQTYSYNEAGQLIQQKNGAQETIAFWYDSSGNQVKRRDARGYETCYEYDAAGHKIKETDALGNSQSWIYASEGRLQEHTDLGGHTTSYRYNTNGLLLNEHSTAGKDINYYYQGDGALIQYSDESRHEVVNYNYDAEGNLTDKESSCGGSILDSWLRETDHYQYDALGRLIAVRRRNPEDTDTRFPDKDKALLSIDYDYDAVGNIRHTNVCANYTGYQQVNTDDYYLYDENDRMILNKGQLVNANIVMTDSQGSTLTYDAAGNLSDALRYEYGSIQKYHYVYNEDNQLRLVQKNGLSIQSKKYDGAGRVVQEKLFDTKGNLSQNNIMTFSKGLLMAQSTRNGLAQEKAKTNYIYDDVGNMTDLVMRINGEKDSAGCTVRHHYSYALWEGYQQEEDDARQTYDKQSSTYGKSTRIYDVNGQLKDAIDTKLDRDGKSNTTHYWNSSVDGIKAREDKEGKTSYLTVAGKTIGDLRLDKSDKQHLNVYSGFTPTGGQQKSKPVLDFMWKGEERLNRLHYFLDRAAENVANGNLPEVPQDNLGVYTVQTGDTLESIALQVYGDSSLWYLLADANGISDRDSRAGSDGQLRTGQRLNVPPTSLGQHQTNATHKVLNANRMIGNTSATMLSLPQPLPQKHNNLLANIVMAVVAVIATVLTAGVLGAIAGGVEGSLSALFNTGIAVLGGSSTMTATGSLAAAFSAGFVGDIASQSVAKAFGLQEGLDLTGALITGLITAATAGLGRGLNSSAKYKNLKATLDKLSISKEFSSSSAAEMMEQNAVSQGLNIALRKHQNFDWEELGIAGITAGLLGSKGGQKLEQNLKDLDHGSGFLNSELQTLAKAAIRSTTGTHANIVQALSDNLGSAIGSSLVNLNCTTADDNPLMAIEDLSLSKDLQEMQAEKQAFNNYLAQQLNGNAGYGELDSNQINEYCPIPLPKKEYTPIPEGLYDQIYPEILPQQQPEETIITQKSLSPELKARVSQLDKIEDWIVDLSAGVDLSILGYEGKKKHDIVKVLMKSGKLHAGKIQNVRELFKTQSSQSYQIADEAVNSKAYKYVNKAGVALGWGYVGVNIYRAYANNEYLGKNVQFREAISAGSGAVADIAVGTGLSYMGGLAGASVGAGFGGVGAVPGYIIGYATAYIVYNFSSVSDYVKDSATNLTRSTWKFVKEHIYEDQEKRKWNHAHIY